MKLSPMLWPTAVAVAVFAVASGLPWVNLGLLGGLLLVAVVGARVETDLLAEVAAAATAATGAFLTVSSEVPESASWRGDQLDGVWVFLALAGLYGSMARQLMVSPRGSDRTTAALNLVAVLACGANEEYRLPGLDDGAARGPLPYLVMVGLYGWAQLDALRRLDPVWERVPRVRRRSTLVLLVAAVVAAPAIWGLPVLHAAFIDYAREQWKASRTGFSEHTELGELHGMLQSDRVILRVDGPAPEHLRGLVYDRYQSGRWIAPMRSAPPATEWHTDETLSTTIDVVGGARDRYFLPLEVAALDIPEGAASADGDGVFTVPGRSATRVRLELGPRAVAPILSPTKNDLLVPPNLQAHLSAWIAERLPSMPTWRDAERVERIASELRNRYQYSLEFSRDSDLDPIVDFLTRETRGHCEYFASAMTLLSRQAGVPARMAIGYRVTEWNPIGGYHIVRERNAHAWTEVYLDGAWKAVDATAASDLPMHSESSVGSALWDSLRAWASAGLAALGRLEWWAVLSLLGFLGLVWGLIRWRRGRTVRFGEDAPGYSPALPAFERLVARLAGAGLERRASEPISDYAERVEATFGGEAPVAPALHAYAALRYGGAGTTTDVVTSLERAGDWLRRRR